uniref:REV HD-ZipIII n=1 Tax=Solanum tuberosum TaxID=4113 RepID=M1AE43_SOLTU
MILANSESNTSLPGSSNILSREMSCNATNVVSSMSSPALLAKMKTGSDCNNRENIINLLTHSCNKTKDWNITRIFNMGMSKKCLEH